jgi:hypothetical protein
VYRRILGIVYENEKEDCRIITNKEIYAVVKKTYHNREIRLHRLHWFGHAQRMKENRVTERVLYMNFAYGFGINKIMMYTKK